MNRLPFLRVAETKHTRKWASGCRDITSFNYLGLLTKLLFLFEIANLLILFLFIPIELMNLLCLRMLLDISDRKLSAKTIVWHYVDILVQCIFSPVNSNLVETDFAGPYISYFTNFALLSGVSRTTDTQWRHKSKKSENLGPCGRQNMLRPYLKIWDLIFAMQWRWFPHRASVVRAWK